MIWSKSTIRRSKQGKHTVDKNFQQDKTPKKRQNMDLWTWDFICCFLLTVVGTAFYKKSLMKGPKVFEQEEPWVMENLNKVFVYGVSGALMISVSLGRAVLTYTGPQKQVLLLWNFALVGLCIITGGFGTKICDHGALNFICLIFIFLISSLFLLLIHVIRRYKIKTKHLLIAIVVFFFVTTPILIMNSIRWRSGIRGQRMAVSSDFVNRKKKEINRLNLLLCCDLFRAATFRFHS